MIRIVIVDDEPLALEGLRTFLERAHDVSIVGEARNGPEAVDLIREERPDLVFLDVEMPGFDGFAVLREVAGEFLPQVIFVTAFNHHAVQAFEVHALDYLLKPVTVDRFAEAMRRARVAIERGADDSTPQRVGDLLDDDEGRRHIERVAVPHRGGFVLVALAEVEWISAASNYIELHTADKTWLMRGTLNALESRLDPRSFVRIHRSVIVALDQVGSVERTDTGEFEVVLRKGTRLSLSRTYRNRLLPA